MGVLGRAALHVRTRLASSGAAFGAAFLAFAAAAVAVAARSPLGPGQDQHYHVLGASITARWWSGDAQVRALYRFVDPLDANTLVYTFLFPFELVLDPVSAWKWGFSALYFVGYPLACVVALRLLRRPLWGALLAFPLAYTKSWSQGGFMPFVSAGPFFVLAVAGMHRVLEDGDRGSDSRGGHGRAHVLVAVASVLAMLAHGHAYAWLMAVLGGLTVVVLVSDLVVGLPRGPLTAVRAAAWKGLRALAVVLPSLALFGLWYFRTHMGANAAEGAGLRASVETWQVKVTTFPAMFVHLAADVDWGHAALLLGIVLFGLLLSGPAPGRGTPTAELALLASLASYFLLPMNVSGQSVSLRHLDFVQWLVPLVVYRSAEGRARARSAAVVSVLAGYAALRFSVLAEGLKALDKEYAGMFELARPCPASKGELAYVTFGTYSRVWAGAAFHQAHESFAALCKLDTPVYDPTIYPHNLLSVRYRGKPPSPITILVDRPRWFEHPNLWRDFELVMVHGWHPNERELSEVSKVAMGVRASGEWQLWQRKPSMEGAP